MWNYFEVVTDKFVNFIVRMKITIFFYIHLPNEFVDIDFCLVNLKTNYYMLFTFMSVKL